jgi:hypothetical protein
MRELPIPVWNQLNDPLPDGQQDPYATTDCGEESVAMIGKGYGGPELPAGQVRMILRAGDVNGPGISSGDDLVHALAAVFHLRSHVRACNAATFQIEATKAINSGMPVIALGQWVSIGFLHWVVGRGADDTGLMTNDPWGGANRLIAWPDVARLYAGTYVHLDQSIGTLPV